MCLWVLAVEHYHSVYKVHEITPLSWIIFLSLKIISVQMKLDMDIDDDDNDDDVDDVDDD